MASKVQYHPLLKTMAAAEKALARGNTRKAVNLYTQVIEDPRSSQLEKEAVAACYLNRGFEMRKTGRREDALRDYARAAELNPRSFKPHLNAALIYAQDFGRYEEAVDEFDKAIELNPTCTEALSSRGLAKMLLDNLEGAEADLQAALALEPRHADTLYNLGNVYLKRGQPEQAAENYRRALEINPRDAEIRFNLALALKQMGADRAAESVLREDKRALRLWKQKGGPASPTPLDVSLFFIRASTPVYAFVMSGAALFMTGSLDGMLIGAVVGAILGAVLGFLLARYARSRPAHHWFIRSVPDWAMAPFPSTHTKVETETGVVGAVLGVILGLIGAWIISLFVAPVYPGSFCLGPMFGFGAGGWAVSRAFRKLSA